MQCCGQDQTTKFCPECGTAMVSPLIALMKHVQSQVRGAVNSFATAEDGIARNDEWLTCWRVRALVASKKRAKWQAWADELEKAIAALAEKEKDNGSND